MQAPLGDLVRTFHMIFNITSVNGLHTLSRARNKLAVDVGYSCGACAFHDKSGCARNVSAIAGRVSLCYLRQHALKTLDVSCHVKPFADVPTLRVVSECCGSKGAIVLLCGLMHHKYVHTTIMWQ